MPFLFSRYRLLALTCDFEMLVFTAAVQGRYSERGFPRG